MNDQWESDPLKNIDINIGCTETCKVREGFRCPKDNQGASLLCTDRCHDGVFDGVDPLIGRLTVPKSSDNLISAAFNTETTNKRIADEECDTGIDKHEGCDDMCRILPGY